MKLENGTLVVKKCPCHDGLLCARVLAGGYPCRASPTVKLDDNGTPVKLEKLENGTPVKLEKLETGTLVKLEDSGRCADGAEISTKDAKGDTASVQKGLKFPQKMLKVTLASVQKVLKFQQRG